MDRCLQTTFLLSTDRKTDKICQDLPRSAKIKQDQPKDRQAQTCKRHLQKQIMKRQAPKVRGRRCHAAWRLQSAPGPWAPEACLTLNLHSLSVIFIDIYHHWISQNLQRSAKIKQDQQKAQQAQACERRLPKRSTKRQVPKMRGGGVTPHGVFNPLRARGRPRRV